MLYVCMFALSRLLYIIQEKQQLRSACRWRCYDECDKAVTLDNSLKQAAHNAVQ